MTGWVGLPHATGPLSTPRRLVGPGPGRCGCQSDEECPRCDGTWGDDSAVHAYLVAHYATHEQRKTA